MPVFALSDSIDFPPPHLADSSGLLAVGGDLGLERLIGAYKRGIFPWYSAGEPILWWSPNPRLVLYPNEIKLSKRLKRIIRKGAFRITFDRAFHEVISACAAPRSSEKAGTWIVPEMMDAYRRLHAFGVAHSVEAWREGRLVGGLYGVSLGGCFFGESMFFRVSNASKVAFAALTAFLLKHHFDLIDCQVTTDHLTGFGAREISRKQFLKQLEISLKKPTLVGPWEDG